MPPTPVATAFMKPTPVERNWGGTISHCVGLSFAWPMPRTNENAAMPAAITGKLGAPRKSSRNGAPAR